MSVGRINVDRRRAYIQSWILVTYPCQLKLADKRVEAGCILAVDVSYDGLKLEAAHYVAHGEAGGNLEAQVRSRQRFAQLIQLADLL